MFLGDHFNPSLALIAPLFWITTDLRILLIEQAVATVAAGVMIYLIAKKFALPYLTSITLAIAYLMFAGVQNPLVTDWHPESTAAFVLLLFIYLVLFSNKKLITILTFLIFIGFKESNAISALFVLGWLFFIKKEQRTQILCLSVFSLIYFVIITRFVIPAIANHPYLYTPGMPDNPVQLFQNFINSGAKIKLITDSFISFGFLPVLSGVALIMPLAELGIRLAPNGTVFNNISLGQHYNVLLGVLLVLATTQAFVNLQKHIPNKIVILHIFTAFLLLTSLYSARKITGSPINVVINPAFYKSFSGDITIRDLQQKLPKQGTVMAQNNLLAYTSNRTDKLYFLETAYRAKNPDIILFNLTPDASINNYYGASKQVAEELKNSLAQDQNYQRINFQDQNTYVYLKKK